MAIKAAPFLTIFLFLLLLVCAGCQAAPAPAVTQAASPDSIAETITPGAAAALPSATQMATQTASAVPTITPAPTLAVEVCSPLQDIPVAQLTGMVSNPFNPPAAGSDDAPPGRGPGRGALRQPGGGGRASGERRAGGNGGGGQPGALPLRPGGAGRDGAFQPAGGVDRCAADTHTRPIARGDHLADLPGARGFLAEGRGTLAVCDVRAPGDNRRSAARRCGGVRAAAGYAGDERQRAQPAFARGDARGGRRACALPAWRITTPAPARMRWPLTAPGGWGVNSNSSTRCGCSLCREPGGMRGGLNHRGTRGTEFGGQD